MGKGPGSVSWNESVSLIPNRYIVNGYSNKLSPPNIGTLVLSIKLLIDRWSSISLSNILILKGVFIKTKCKRVTLTNSSQTYHSINVKIEEL